MELTHLGAAKMHSRPERTASVSFPLAKFLFEVFIFLSALPLSAALSDAMGVELFFVVRTASGSGAGWRFCAACALPRSLVLMRSSENRTSKKFNHFYLPVGPVSLPKSMKVRVVCGGS